MIAYILITVPANSSHKVADFIKELPGVEEVAPIYGGADVFVKVVIDSEDELAELVMEKIQKMENVEETRTFIAISKLHWQR